MRAYALLHVDRRHTSTCIRLRDLQVLNLEAFGTQASWVVQWYLCLWLARRACVGGLTGCGDHPPTVRMYTLTVCAGRSPTPVYPAAAPVLHGTVCIQYVVAGLGLTT